MEPSDFLLVVFFRFKTVPGYLSQLGECGLQNLSRLSISMEGWDNDWVSFLGELFL